MSNITSRTVEGWEKPAAVRLWHYYRADNVSLCKIAQLSMPGQRTPDRGSPHDRCPKCYELTK